MLQLGNHDRDAVSRLFTAVDKLSNPKVDMSEPEKIRSQMGELDGPETSLLVYLPATDRLSHIYIYRLGATRCCRSRSYRRHALDDFRLVLPCH